jgi:hypothetical protein
LFGSPEDCSSPIESTQQPRQHHFDMAMHVLMYLMTYINVPVVLGGNQDISIISSTDASYGTAPKGRSISGHLIRLLNDISGVVLAKSKASTSVVLSSFEAELYGTANAI